MKQFSEIKIKVTRLNNGDSSDWREIDSITLLEKIEAYIPRLGGMSSHTLGFVLQLLTVGKVRMDFRDYHERLELLDKADIMTRAQALIAMDEYLSSSDKISETHLDATQKIIIQPPRRPAL